MTLIEVAVWVVFMVLVFLRDTAFLWVIPTPETVRAVPSLVDAATELQIPISLMSMSPDRILQFESRWPTAEACVVQALDTAGSFLYCWQHLLTLSDTTPSGRSAENGAAGHVLAPQPAGIDYGDQGFTPT